jgi:glycosyltransferase involved in cell wall biosynthesis
MIDLTIYLLCYNEEVLLPHALHHYKSRFPNAKFIIIDNESTDRSVEIAKEAGCEIHTWATKGIANIILNTELKNSIWKSATTDWILLADMDEWLHLTEEQLEKENSLGSTILHCRGLQIVGDSKSTILDDVNLHELRTGFWDTGFNKHICFKRSDITEINYTRGAHKSSPKGNVKFSKGIYIMKHMNYLGFPWYNAKTRARYDRTHYNRSLRCSGHYSNNEKVITDKFASAQKNAVLHTLQ